MAFDKRNPAHRKRACERLATRQFGLVTLDQARSYGLTGPTLTRLVTAGTWSRKYPGVYSLSSVPESLEQRVLAAVMWAGPGAVATHRSAGSLWGMDGCTPGVVDITVERGGKSRAPAGIKLRQRHLPRKDKTHLGIIPITTPIRTLIDLGAVLTQNEVEFALEDCIHRDLVDVDRFERRVADLTESRCRGLGVVRRLLASRGPDPAPESRLEVELQQLMRRAGLPLPRRQFVVKDHDGFVARLDFAFPEALVAVEAEGYRYHSGRQAWERDAKRRNHLQRLGWRVIVVTWRRLREAPHEIIRELEELLGIQRLL